MLERLGVGDEGLDRGVGPRRSRWLGGDRRHYRGRHIGVRIARRERQLDAALHLIDPRRNFDECT